MSAITEIRCALTRKAFDAFCTKYHIPEEVHPVLPNQNDTIHERPVGKIGLYTRFFDYANFRLPLFSFLVDVLRYFRINISQLSVIGAAKVSHFEILCRVYGIVPTAGLFRCFYVNSKKNGWISFSKRSDNAPGSRSGSGRFSAQDYATLVAHPSPFRKFPEEFMCLEGLSRHYTFDEETYPLFLDKDGEDMDLFAFIHTPDPTKVKVFERERKDDEPRLLETTVGRTVPLLSVVPDRGASELEASIDKLFDEDGSGNQTEQEDSAGGGGEIGKLCHDAGESSHPPKKLREDHGTPSGTSVGGKSRSSLQRLLAGVVLNAEVRGEVVPTLPLSHLSFVISSDSSHHSGANVAEAEVDSLARSFVLVIIAVTTTTPTADPAVVVKEKTSRPSLFAADSSSAGGADPNAGVFSDLTGSDFLVSGVRTVIDLNTDL
ncbi:hypothetical protein Tco_1219388 [Tanacetum coccineum]